MALDGVTEPAIVRDARIRDGFDGYDGDTKLGTKHNQEFAFDAADMNRSNEGFVGATGAGVLTQVFVDPTYDNGSGRLDGKVWIAVINTYLVRAKQDYDTRREELVLDAYSVDKYNDEYVALPKSGISEQIRLGVEDYPIVKDASEKDAFLVTFAEGEVQTIVPAEVIDAVTISSFKSKDNLVVDGTKYNFTTTTGFDADTLKIYTGGNITNLKDRTYNVFLDAYGNTIGVQEVDAKKNYVFLAAIDINDSNLVNSTANAKAIFLDGTVDTIRVNLDKSTLDWYKNGDEPGGYNKNSILNTWCTYTVNNSSVYTVKQVMDINAKGDSYVPGTNNGTGLAQYHQTGFTNDYKIDKKHITLRGTNDEGVGNAYYCVYGNEKTVYLTAELGNLANDGGKWGVVKDVDSVTTAAENVNLTVWTDTQAQTEAENSSSPSVALSGNAYATKGVYTLYDDDGIVIAIVVVGEDDGSTRNLVYVHSGSIESETYNGDGLWTWTCKVIKNGEEVTLTEVSDGNSELDKIQQYHWYQIKTNADGEVTGVYRLRDDNRTTGDYAATAKHRSLTIANLDRYDDYALDYHYYDINGNGVQNLPDETGEIAYTVQNGAGTVLYWNENLITSRLRMNGRTLYVATGDQTGFIVNSNVKWVVQQWDNNKKETYIDEGSSASGLKNMIDEVNRRYTNNENYTYQVSAVIESGIASSVVIYFNENYYNRPNTGNRPTGEAVLDWDRISENWTLTVPAGVDVDNLTTTQVRDYLTKVSCSNISKTRDSWTFTIDGTRYDDQIVKVVAKAGPTTYTVTVGAAEGDTVTVTATPEDGYKLGTVSVKETVSGKTVTVTDGKFTMPAAVTVTAEFEKITYKITIGTITGGTVTANPTNAVMGPSSLPS